MHIIVNQTGILDRYVSQTFFDGKLQQLPPTRHESLWHPPGEEQSKEPIHWISFEGTPDYKIDSISAKSLAYSAFIYHYIADSSRSFNPPTFKSLPISENLSLLQVAPETSLATHYCSHTLISLCWPVPSNLPLHPRWLLVA